MKKPTLILGKKHIILACLTLILGIAIYLNYAFTTTGDGIKTTGADADTMSGTSSDSGANYGDAAFVNGGETEDYFAQARLEKLTSRDKAVETFKAMLGGGDLTEEEVATMTLEAVNTSKLIESEGVVESLIKAQGFTDCVVYFDDDTANIVVKTEGLIPSEAAQIKDIVLSKVTVPNENITIFEVK